jgi:pyruvate dehydrogenase E2 component (dihydrolipoamide acetyltransferase)
MADIVTMPKMGFDMAEGVLVRWVVGVGESVNKGELLAEIETDKATVEVESTYSGTVLKHLVQEQDIVPVNEPIAIIGEEGEDISGLNVGDEDEEAEAQPAASTDEETEAAIPTPVEAEPADAGANLPDGVRASPLARNMARVNEIDLSKVQGSGPKGRIVKADVEAYMANPPAPEPKAAAPAPAASFTAPSYATAKAEDTTIPLTKLRQAIGRRLTESKQWFPHFYVTYEYDLDALMAFRKQANSMLADQGVKLSVNDFIIKAVALTLRGFPNLNASLGDKEIVRHGDINVGVAVSVDGGLMTVVCHTADQKTLSAISNEVKAKAGRAREGKVQPDDVSGSTFTTSNLGMYGVDDFIAIINPPEAAILAIGGGKQVPVVKDGEITVGWRMKATISADHRVTDGAEAADFMRSMAKYLENPMLMMV